MKIFALHTHLKAIQFVFEVIRKETVPLRAVFLPVAVTMFFSCLLPVSLVAQVTDTTSVADTVVYAADSIPGGDTLNLAKPDSLRKKEGLGLENQVKYHSYKKIHFDLRNRKVFLYDQAEIEYGDITLKANYIEIDFANNQVYARGVPDSTGKMQGQPVFTESGQSFDAGEITYNFDTKAGLIKHVITQDGEGYLHGQKIKKMPDDRINIKNGSYTTCDLPHPHYEFRYNRAQVIPNNKIVSGPAYMVIEGVPMPLFIPFGMFPNKSGRRSGIIIPAFGESANRGFFLEHGGYYWGINDHMDLTLTGDIYTSGSWAIRPSFRYAKRYKYRGNFDFSYAKNILGDRDAPDVNIRKDFSVRWSHAQDPKARPHGRFSASVNIVSSDYNQFNLTNTEAYLSNTFQSSISYQTSFNDNLFFNATASHSQNTQDRTVSITLPSLSFYTKQIYPFRRKKQIGQPRWYENINIKYTMNAENSIQTKDTLLFKPGWEDGFRYGAKHNIPISSSVKVLKYFTLTNGANYSERWYPYTIRKTWVSDTIITPEEDTLNGFVRNDTVRGFRAAREFSYTASLNTRLYGMYQFKKGPVAAIRHMVTPSLSFNYHPDFGSDFWNYYDQVQVNAEGKMQRYSYFDGLLYGGPPDGRSGNISFSLNNNLEMKVRSKRDTVSGLKKVVLIDNLSVQMSYDIAKDSLNWSPLTINGHTTIFKRLTITYSSSWDPYAVDSAGNTINKFEWDVNHRLFRMKSASWNFGMTFRIGSSDFNKKKNGEETSQENLPLEEPAVRAYNDREQVFRTMDDPNLYVNWNNTWNLSFTYNLRFGNTPRYVNYMRENNSAISAHTLGVTGDLSVTPKWKVTFRSGYDIEKSALTYTEFGFYRDLHCWEMNFRWIPTGTRKSWTFGINVKSSILRDLKYERKKDFRDSYR